MSKIDLMGLDIIHRLAIEKRYLGKSYARICEEILEEIGTSLNDKTVTKWFMEGGILFEHYYQYAEQQNRIRDKEAQIFWRGQLMNAVAVVSDEMREGSPKRLEAAKIVIDSIWGKSIRPIEVTGEIDLNVKYQHMTTDEIRARIVALKREIESNKTYNLSNADKSPLPNRPKG